jgi:hypothetical protein
MGLKTIKMQVTLPQYFGAYIREFGLLKFYTYINNTITPIQPIIQFNFFENIVKRSIYIHNTYYDAYVVGDIGVIGDTRILLYIFNDAFVRKYLYSNNNNVFFLMNTNFEIDIINAKIESLSVRHTPVISSDSTLPLTGCSSVSTIPSYVIELIKQDAVKKQETCPILYDSLTMDNSVVTSCFHTFSKTGITEWLKNNSACPKCRQKCTICA